MKNKLVLSSRKIFFCLLEVSRNCFMKILIKETSNINMVLNVLINLDVVFH